jgi:hypothetical protein
MWVGTAIRTPASTGYSVFAILKSWCAAHAVSSVAPTIPSNCITRQTISSDPRRNAVAATDPRHQRSWPRSWRTSAAARCILRSTGWRVISW